MSELESTYHAIKEFLPNGSFVVISMVFSQGIGTWQCQAYISNVAPLEPIVQIHAHDGCKTSGQLINIARLRYEKYLGSQPTTEEKIKQLEAQIAALKG